MGWPTCSSLYSRLPGVTRVPDFNIKRRVGRRLEHMSYRLLPELGSNLGIQVIPSLACPKDKELCAC